MATACASLLNASILALALYKQEPVLFAGLAKLTGKTSLVSFGASAITFLPHK